MSAVDAFLDTNVLLYLISHDVEKADRAEALLRSPCVVSVQVLNECVAVARGKYKLDLARVVALLSAIRAKCAVVPLDVATHERAMDLVVDHRFSIYAATIVASAVLARCTLLYSEDMQHGQRIENLTIRNPFIDL